ncbi:8510_t:CDS:2, partial [Diversispora eburnea]
MRTVSGEQKLTKYSLRLLPLTLGMTLFSLKAEQVGNSVTAEESHKQVVEVESIDNDNVYNKSKNKLIICVDFSES